MQKNRKANRQQLVVLGKILNIKCWWLTDRKQRKSQTIQTLLHRKKTTSKLTLEKLFSHTSSLFGDHIPCRRMFQKTGKSTTPNTIWDRLLGEGSFLFARVDALEHEQFLQQVFLSLCSFTNNCSQSGKRRFKAPDTSKSGKHSTLFL